MGCDTVRIGFEDNIYLPNGKAGEHNGQLVESTSSRSPAYLAANLPA